MLILLNLIMAKFVTGEELIQAVDDIIHNAQSRLLIVSPFIRLDDYFKDLFSVHKNNPQVEIILVFGKNEYDVSRSLREDDFNFFKTFPNIGIVYVPNLHAKYFSNETLGVVTSINLLDASFKNNIEFGVIGEPKLIGGTDKFDNEAWQASMEVVSQGKAVFARVPLFKKKMFGLAKDYMSSESVWDSTDDLLNGKTFEKRDIFEFLDKDKFMEFEPKSKPQRADYGAESKVAKTRKHYETHQDDHGYCIRCKTEIPYDVNRPYCHSCYKIWAQFNNPDYEEQVCHSCGKQEDSSMQKPECYDCYKTLR